MTKAYISSPACSTMTAASNSLPEHSPLQHTASNQLQDANHTLIPNLLTLSPDLIHIVLRHVPIQTRKTLRSCCRALRFHSDQCTTGIQLNSIVHLPPRRPVDLGSQFPNVQDLELNFIDQELDPLLQDWIAGNPVLLSNLKSLTLCCDEYGDDAWMLLSTNTLGLIYACSHLTQLHLATGLNPEWTESSTEPKAKEEGQEGESDEDFFAEDELCDVIALTFQFPQGAYASHLGDILHFIMLPLNLPLLSTPLVHSCLVGLSLGFDTADGFQNLAATLSAAAAAAKLTRLELKGYPFQGVKNDEILQISRLTGLRELVLLNEPCELDDDVPGNPGVWGALVGLSSLVSLTIGTTDLGGFDVFSVPASWSTFTQLRALTLEAPKVLNVQQLSSLVPLTRLQVKYVGHQPQDFLAHLTNLVVTKVYKERTERHLELMSEGWDDLGDSTSEDSDDDDDEDVDGEGSSGLFDSSLGSLIDSDVSGDSGDSGEMGEMGEMGELDEPDGSNGSEGEEPQGDVEDAVGAANNQDSDGDCEMDENEHGAQMHDAKK